MYVLNPKRQFHMHILCCSYNVQNCILRIVYKYSCNSPIIVPSIDERLELYVAYCKQLSIIRCHGNY